MSSSNDSLGPERRSKPIWKPLTIETPDWLKPFVPRALVLLRHKWITIVSWIFSRAAWTSWNASGECADQFSSHIGDRVRDVTFGPDRRHLWVDNQGEAQVAGAPRRDEVRRGNRLPFGDQESVSRDAPWRGVGSLASLALRSAQGGGDVRGQHREPIFSRFFSPLGHSISNH